MPWKDRIRMMTPLGSLAVLIRSYVFRLGFLDAIREGKSSPIPMDEILEVSRVSIEVAETQ